MRLHEASGIRLVSSSVSAFGDERQQLAHGVGQQREHVGRECGAAALREREPVRRTRQSARRQRARERRWRRGRLLLRGRVGACHERLSQLIRTASAIEKSTQHTQNVPVPHILLVCIISL